MLREPDVSVVVPVYNVEKYLMECLDSIINQTLKNIEIICIDDGSTDSSMMILQEYACKDNRIVVLNQKHLGAGAARNMGIKVSTGKYLAFLDSDDFFDSKMLEKCFKNLEENQSDILVFSANQFDDKRKKVLYMPWSLRVNNCPSVCFEPICMKDKLFNTFQNWSWNKLFRRKFVLKNNILFQEIPRTNDMAFVCEALVLADSISILNEPFAYYRVNTGNSLQQTNDNSPTSFWDACIETKRRLKFNGLYEVYKRTLINAVISGALYNFRTVKTWNAYKEIFYILKYEIEKEFVVTSYGRDFFYDLDSYNKLNQIMRFDLDEYLYIYMKYWRDRERDSESKHSDKKKNLILGCIKCYKQHGFQYTLKRILYHLGI